MTSCYTVCHLFGKIHQNKAAAPLLTCRNEGNVLSVPPLETHGRALWVICHCWQVFYAVLSGPVVQHVLWHAPGGVATLKLLSSSCVVPELFQTPFDEILSTQLPKKWCRETWDWGGDVFGISAWWVCLLLGNTLWNSLISHWFPFEFKSS